MAKGDYRKIHTRHARAYQSIMRTLVSIHGSINKALLAIGISDHAYYKLINDEEIVVCTARKIVDCYERTKASK